MSAPLPGRAAWYSPWFRQSLARQAPSRWYQARWWRPSRSLRTPRLAAAVAVSSADRVLCLEREGEEGRYGEEGECYQMIPCHFLLQERNREHHEDDERDHLLNDLELES